MTDEPIGRGRELALLLGALERPAAGLRVVLLVGDPGIGKSTLWNAALEAGRERSSTVLASRPAETERDLSHPVLGDLFRYVAPSLLATLPGP